MTANVVIRTWKFLAHGLPAGVIQLLENAVPKMLVPTSVPSYDTEYEVNSGSPNELPVLVAVPPVKLTVDWISTHSDPFQTCGHVGTHAEPFQTRADCVVTHAEPLQTFVAPIRFAARHRRRLTRQGQSDRELQIRARHRYSPPTRDVGSVPLPMLHYPPDLSDRGQSMKHQ